MSAPMQKWLRGLQSSSLFRPQPQNSDNKKHIEVLAYVELLGQFTTSESFVDDIGELVRIHYPSQENCLLDDVLATLILHYPEHGHAIVHALLSCVIDGTILYEKKNPPFRALISLFSPSTERDFSERWAIACGEILRVLTHYNRPILKADRGQPLGTHACPSASGEGSGKGSQDDSAREIRGRKSRLLTPWITDSLLAASPPIRNDYFRWCGGVMGKYAAGEELRPPTTVGDGKQPWILPSTPRWAVANGAAVILSVCDSEVTRYETADLTASAVPALIIHPPPPTLENEDLAVLGVPLLEPYARLFHRYYAIATPGATQRLLLGLLETPPVGAPHGLLVAVALIDILRVTDDSSSSVQLPRDWLYIHFLMPAATAMATRFGIIADAAAALLYHVFLQPALLVPPPSRSHGDSAVQSLYGCATLPSGTEEAKATLSQANDNATARGLAALMVGHGPEVEWRLCALWEAALGLRTVSPHVVDLPKLVLSTPLPPPVLSWNLVRPLLCILEYLPAKSKSHDCLRRMFTATVEAILQRTFPREEASEQKDGSQSTSPSAGARVGTKIVGMAELRAMVHCLFTESFISRNLAAQLLSDALTICLSHDTKREMDFREALENGKTGNSSSFEALKRPSGDEAGKNRGAVATFDSYVVAAVCALACEVRLLSFSPAYLTVSKPVVVAMTRVESNGQGGSSGVQDGRRPSLALPGGFPIGGASLAEHTKRLGLLELLLAGLPSLGATRTCDNSTTTEILGESVVAAHMSLLLGQSRACLHSLTEVMKCEWDPGICAQAVAVVARIESNGGLVSVANYGRSWHSSSDSVAPHASEEGSDMVARDLDQASKTLSLDPYRDGSLQMSPNRGRLTNLPNGQRHKFPNGVGRGHVEKEVATLPLEAADVAALLCKDRWNGHSAVFTASLRPVMAEKQHLAIGSAALLCQRLVFSPEIPNNADGISAERGWHQVVEALCNMAAALPEKVAPFIVAQGMAGKTEHSLPVTLRLDTLGTLRREWFILSAETQLQPWTGKDDVQSQKSVWKVNARIVSLLCGLLRLWNFPDVVKVVVQDCALLRRATGGLMIDVEGCTLPQLELGDSAEPVRINFELILAVDGFDLQLLEAAAGAAKAARKWEEPQEEIPDMLFSLLRERLPATVRCLSHSSSHVRAMSVAQLRDMLYFESSRSSYSEAGVEGDTLENGDLGSNNWKTAVEQCIMWEAHYLRAGGMSISLLANAAIALGCSISF